MAILTLLAIFIGVFAIFMTMIIDLYYWITEMISLNLGIQVLLMAIIVILIATCIKIEKSIQSDKIDE